VNLDSVKDSQAVLLTSHALENDTEMKFNPFNHLRYLSVTDTNNQIIFDQGGLLINSDSMRVC
jgi:hypothetical protein